MEQKPERFTCCAEIMKVQKTLWRNAAYRYPEIAKYVIISWFSSLNHSHYDTKKNQLFQKPRILLSLSLSLKLYVSKACICLGCAFYLTSESYTCYSLSLPIYHAGNTLNTLTTV